MKIKLIYIFLNYEFFAGKINLLSNNRWYILAFLFCIVYDKTNIIYINRRGNITMLNISKGKDLTMLGQLYGVKRRFFGLEPDFMFRARIYKLSVGFLVNKVTSTVSK